MTGASRNSSMPAKRTTSSNRAGDLLLRNRPSNRPVISMFSRPEISGWNPAPSSSSAASLPRTATEPRVGRTMPASSLSSVDLPEPFGTDDPERFAGGDREGHPVGEGHDCRPRPGCCGGGRDSRADSASRGPRARSGGGAGRILVAPATAIAGSGPLTLPPRGCRADARRPRHRPRGAPGGGRPCPPSTASPDDATGRK